MPQYQSLGGRVNNGFFAGMGNSVRDFYNDYIAGIGRPALCAAVILGVVAGCNGDNGRVNATRGDNKQDVGQIVNSTTVPVEVPVGGDETQEPGKEDKRTKEELINSLFSYYREQYGKYYEKMSREDLGALIGDKETGYYIIQFHQNPTKEQNKEIGNMGVEPLLYVPKLSGVYRFDPVKRRQIEALPYVRWVGIYQPIYKLSRDLLKMYSETDLSNNSESIELNLQVFGDVDEVKNSITDLGGVVNNVVDNFMTITIEKRKISSIISLAEVESAELKKEIKILSPQKEPKK